MTETLKWLKRVALCLAAIFGITLSVMAFLSYRAGARLEERIAALRAAGQPTSLAELAPQPISPEENADTYLRRAGPEVEALNQAVQAAFDASTREEQDAFDAFQPLGGMLESTRAALAAHPAAMQLVAEASRCESYDAGLDYQLAPDAFMESLLPNVQVFRGLCRALEYQMLVQLADGQRDAALETCLVMFRLARLLDQNPTIVSQLVALAVRGLAVTNTDVVLRSGPFDAAKYAELETELARHDPLETYRHALATDRCYGLESFAGWAEGPLRATARLAPWFKKDECDYLDLMATAIDASRQPFAQGKSEINAAATADGIGTLTRLMLPALESIHSASFRVLALLRSLRVLNALEARGQTGEAGEAGTPALDELGLAAEVTTDPFNGQPLTLKHTPKGWLIYSVGPNLKDDGGDLVDYHDVGIGPLPAVNTGSDAPAQEQAPP